MASWTGEEVVEGIDKWLNHRLQQAKNRGDGIEAEVTYIVLDDAQSAFAEGWMPWQDAWLEKE
jgi:hypothetical protein